MRFEATTFGVTSNLEPEIVAHILDTIPDVHRLQCVSIVGRLEQFDIRDGSGAVVETRTVVTGYDYTLRFEA